MLSKFRQLNCPNMRQYVPLRASMGQHCSLSAVQRQTAFVEQSWWRLHQCHGGWCLCPWQKLGWRKILVAETAKPIATPRSTHFPHNTSAVCCHGMHPVGCLKNISNIKDFHDVSMHLAHVGTWITGPAMWQSLFLWTPAVSCPLATERVNKDEVGKRLWICLSLHLWQTAMWPHVGTLNSARSTFSSFDSTLKLLEQ